MNFTKNFLAATALIFASSASATYTPSFYGVTSSETDLIAGTASGSTDWGYYIWNDKDDSKTWNVRWTGLGASESTPTWFGNIQFQESNLDSSFNASNSSAPNQYQLEFGGAYGDSVTSYLDVSFIGGDDVIDWTARTNNTGGIDGFSFTLTSNVEVLEFELGSSLFSGMSGTDITGYHVFIGEKLLTPNVTFTDYNNGGVAQQFEISVPEPSILALFGLGLAGVGFMSKKRKRS